MPLIVLNGTRQGSFRRVVRDKRGEFIRLLVFHARQPVYVEDDEMSAIQADIGHALAYADRDSNGEWRVSDQEPELPLPDETPAAANTAETGATPIDALVASLDDEAPEVMPEPETPVAEADAPATPKRKARG